MEGMEDVLEDLKRMESKEGMNGGTYRLCQIRLTWSTSTPANEALRCL